MKQKTWLVDDDVFDPGVIVLELKFGSISATAFSPVTC